MQNYLVLETVVELYTMIGNFTSGKLETPYYFVDPCQYAEIKIYEPENGLVFDYVLWSGFASYFIEIEVVTDYKFCRNYMTDFNSSATFIEFMDDELFMMSTNVSLARQEPYVGTVEAYVWKNYQNRTFYRNSTLATAIV
jgi:hypothetical protein